MKKLLLLTLMLIGASTLVKAQTRANTTLTLRLVPLMSIQVSQPSVSIDVDSEQEYMEGASTYIKDHVTTFSTSGFVVKVKSLNQSLSKGADTLPLNTIAISASGQNNMTYANVDLSGTSTPLITSTLVRGRKTHDVSYTADSGLYDKPSGDYTVEIQYEIVTL